MKYKIKVEHEAENGKIYVSGIAVDHNEPPHEVMKRLQSLLQNADEEVRRIRDEVSNAPKPA